MAYFTNLSRELNCAMIKLLPQVENERIIMGVAFPINPFSRMDTVYTTLPALRTAYDRAINDEHNQLNWANELPEDLDTYVACLERQENRPFLRINDDIHPWGLQFINENPRKLDEILLLRRRAVSLRGDLETSLERLPALLYHRG